MEITVAQLEAKRQEYLAAIEEIKGNLNATYGALQAVDNLLAQLKAPAPAAAPSKK